MDKIHFSGIKNSQDVILRPKAEESRSFAEFTLEDVTPLRMTRGFTLIELMLVVIIIGALVAMVLPRLAGRSEQARVSAARADISSNIATALKLYELDSGSYPSSGDGLNALLSKPGDQKAWNGPYLEKKPLDPWGREYQYKSPGSHRPHDYDLSSLGKDGQVSADDISNWE